jgi:hypothetical protein
VLPRLVCGRESLLGASRLIDTPNPKRDVGHFAKFSTDVVASVISQHHRLIVQLIGLPARLLHLFTPVGHPSVTPFAVFNKATPSPL